MHILVYSSSGRAFWVLTIVDEKLDDDFVGALAAVVENYGGGNRLVSVQNADCLVCDELERRGYLSFLDYDLSGGAILTHYTKPFLIIER